MGPNISILIPALLLVLVASLPSAPGLRFRTATAAYALFSVLAVTLLWHGIRRSSLRSGTFESSVRKYAAAELNQTRARNVIVIDGGSYVLNGVDTEHLNDELKKLGYSAHAVRLAAGGANHFERYTLNEEVVRDLGPKRDGQRWVYLAEVHTSYDRMPLSQFDDHQDTVRVLHYLTPGNAWYAVRALQSDGVEAPLAGEWEWPVFRHTLLNAFNVGVSSRIAPGSDVEVGSGRASNTRRPFARFRGLAPLRTYARAPESPEALNLPWLKSIRERRLVRLWRPYVDELVYFGVPSTLVGQLRYIDSFCNETERKCIEPDKLELIDELDAKRNWRNAGHMRAAGAEIYSRWLAHELHRLRVLRR